MSKINNYISMILISIPCFFIVNSYSNIHEYNVIQVAVFSMMKLDGWDSKSFQGETHYSFDTENQKNFLRANSNQSASALYKKIKVNIDETPYLNWRWRVDQALPELNEKEKNGDDYVARVYVTKV